MSSMMMWRRFGARVMPAVNRRWGSSFLDKAEVQERVLGVVKKFPKVDEHKVNINSHFNRDLALDSLDAVELVMEIETEFNVEIPDDVAEKMLTCEDAINYIGSHPMAK